MPLDDDLLDEVRRARAVTQQIARKRQIQFLAKQLRRLDDEELEPIRARLDNDRQQSRLEAAALHHAEQWRERLIGEGDEALNGTPYRQPAADRQQLRRLARQSKTERDGTDRRTRNANCSARCASCSANAEALLLRGQRFRIDATFRNWWRGRRLTTRLFGLERDVQRIGIQIARRAGAHVDTRADRAAEQHVAR